MNDAPWTYSVQELAKAVSGQVLSGPGADFHGVGTDTRAALTGRLFVPLKGENFDAHDFIPKAVEQGAAAVLTHQWRPEWDSLLSKASFIRVGDTLLALQAFARHWRRLHKFKVIGITGSNGKTSTKEFAYSLIKDSIPTFASKGSYNNHWGVPLSILSAGPETKLLIQEMGMNKMGEIFALCQIAEPDIAVVTTVGRAHIGELGSETNIAQAKEEIYFASPKAIHVFNMDNEWTIRMEARSKSPQVLFSAFRGDVDVHLRAERMTWSGLDLTGRIRGVEGKATAHVLGRQNVVNLMAAASLALAAGLPAEVIWKRLGEIRDTAWGRNQVLSLEGGARLLFDAYNANPDSMTALLKNLYEMEVEGRKFLIVGDMKELGSYAEAAHEEIGERAGSVGFEKIWYIGQYAPAFTRGLAKTGSAKVLRATAKIDPAVSDEFFKSLRTGDLVAVKGSRGMELEKVFSAWPLLTPLGKKP